MSDPFGGNSNYPAGAERDPRAPYNQSEPDQCEFCEGTGKVPCSTCDERIHPNEDCAECDNSRLEVCPDCGGSGEAEEKSREEIECEKADRARDEAKDREAEERE